MRGMLRLKSAISGLIGAAIVAWSAISVAGAFTKTRPPVDFPSMAERYRPVRDRIAGLERLGFVCEEGDPDRYAFKSWLAQSLLAPTLLIQSDEPKIILANFDDEQRLTQYLQSRPLRIRDHFGNGVAILEREAK